ncbi:MAG: sulfatase, partial [Planctomycetes bacterium]|nr:sulfatase [Planctomycetota bacterium]
MRKPSTRISLFCRTASLALAIAAVGSVVYSQEARTEPSRPNVLLLLADNWAWPHAGACGDKSVSTPTFDRIARNGALFRYTFCQVPSCSAARAVLLSGQAMHRLGEAANLWGRFPDRLKVYPRLLAQKGYVVGHSIKGWGPGHYRGKKHTGINPAGKKYPNFEAFLKKLPRGKPFCFWFGSHDPHQPWNRGDKFRTGLDPDKVEVPPYIPDHPVVRNTIVDYYAEVQRFDHECGELLKLLKSRGQLANTLVMMVGDNGWQMPRGLANVYDAGTRVPMAIQWPESIKGGQSLDHFISFEDFAPTFLAAAGLPALKEMTGNDFLPLTTGSGEVPWRSAVFLERERHANVRAGNRSYPCRAIRTKRHLYVRNLEPELWAAGDPKTRWAVGPYGDIDNTPIKELILSQRDKPEIRRFFELAFLKRPAEELYDLSKDPHQMKNVAALAGYAELKRDLTHRLDAWMKATEDPRAG